MQRATDKPFEMGDSVQLRWDCEVSLSMGARPDVLLGSSCDVRSHQGFLFHASVGGQTSLNPSGCEDLHGIHL